MSKILANQIANYGDDSPIEIKEGLNIPTGKPLQAAGVAGSSGQVLSSTGTTIQWVSPFSGSYNDLTDKPSIPAAQVASDWNATSGVSRILNKPVVPLVPVVVTAPAGTAALSYNSTNGEFTFTPQDLSGYATEAWVGTQGFLTSYAETDTLDDVTGRGASTTNTITVGELTVSNDGTDNGKFVINDRGNYTQLDWYTSSGAPGANIQGVEGNLYLNATNMSLGFGNNISSDGQVHFNNTTPRTTSVNFYNGFTVIDGDLALNSANITTTGRILYSNNFATLGDLPGASTYHGMFAHVHAEGHGYFAHAGGWIQLLDTGSSIGDTSDVDLSVAPSDGYVLKWDASSSSWKAQPDLVGSGGSGIVLSDLSVNQDPAGTPSLTYSNTTGVFTYTPPDLAGYLTTETDPVFSASPAAGILSSNISNWDAAYGWGNHANAGYLTSLSIDLDDLTDVSVASPSTNDVLSWNGSAWIATAPAAANLNGETLQVITDRGAVTTNDIQVNKIHTDTILAVGPTAGDASTGIYVSMEWDGGGTYRDMKLKTTSGGGTVTLMSLSANTSTVSTTYPFTAGSLTASGTSPSLSIYNSSQTGFASFIYNLVGNAQYQLPALPTTNGDVLSCTTAGVMSWVTPASGGGGSGANVTISDTIPAGTPTAGDLWWESDTGRLKIYYTDTDSSQWVDTNPPLADATSIGGSGTVSMKASLIPDTNDAYDLGNAEYKIRDIYEADPSDARLKTDVVDYTGGLAFVESLRVVDFTWKDDVDIKAGKRETGLIAQEVKEALDASNYNSWRLHTDGDLQGVDKKQLIPALISAIQELSARVKELENK